MGFAKRLWRDEDGVVESSLVIIPVLVLFLISVDLAVAVNMRNIDLARVQSRAESIALGAPSGGTDRIFALSSSKSPTTISIVLTHQTRQIPDLLAGLMTFTGVHVRSTDVSGLAVQESNP